MQLLEVEPHQYPQHAYLQPGDRCFHWWDYTSGAGFGTDGNSVIANIKKNPHTCSPNEKFYKDRDIERVGQLIAATFIPADTLIFVPVPPSRCRADPNYDGRLASVLTRAQAAQSAASRPSLAFAELVRQKVTRQAMHASGGNRLTVDQLASGFEVADREVPNRPMQYVIFDDLLVSGTHYRAMVQVLEPHVADGSKFIGLFVARRAIQDDGLPPRISF